MLYTYIMINSTLEDMQKNTKNTEPKPQLSIKLTQELDKEFRDAVFHSKGMKKGVMLEAVTEALELWIKANSKSQPEKRSRGTSND